MPWLAWCVVLAVSAASYWHERALDHFVWHLAYGGSAGVLAGSFVAWARRRGARRDQAASPGARAWTAWALAGYAYMVIPDLLWFAGRVATGAPWDHTPWMDVFLLHVSLDGFPHASAAAPAVVGVAAATFWITRAPPGGDRRPPEPEAPQAPRGPP